MDFFGAQDLARRRTWQLAALFGAAVLSLVVLTNLLVALVYAWRLGFGYGDPLDAMGPLRRLPAGYWFWITLAVVGAVTAACVYKYLWLRGGGRTVAESLGGRLVGQGTTDPAERRLLNVVEEMAIAAGLPVPPVYVIPQPSINAFAAGLGFGDAVIGVSQGALAHLNRDELQGVIGHEFSHLLNGDTRLNLRLLALLHGILFIGLVGEGLLRGSGRGSSSGRGSLTARSGSAGLPILLLGVGLTLIGYTGTLFGKLIKAAVSRQREYLADAAAVQFTRNPQGIGGALKKIGGLAAGSRLPGPAASEASHLFFGPVAPAWLGRLTATHPPLEQRIRAVDPAWDGRYPAVVPGVEEALGGSALGPGEDALEIVAPSAALGAQAAGPAGTGPSHRAAPASTARPMRGAAPGPDEVSAAVGRVDDAALDQADRLVRGLPPELLAAARDPWAARALLFALVTTGSETPNAGRAPTERSQVERTKTIEGSGEPALAAAAAQLAARAAQLDEARRLVLVELAMPALKQMSLPQFRQFSATLVALIRLDRRIDLFEWALQRLLIRDLRAHFVTPRRRYTEPHLMPAGPLLPKAGTRALVRYTDAAATLLSALAREEAPARFPEGPPTAAGAGSGTADAAAAFRAGIAVAGITAGFDPAPDPDFVRLNRALALLQTLPPLQKPRLIKACAATVLADGRISARQGALLQGVAAALDCPLPPSIHAGWSDVRTARA